ncbi:DUF742 domain-containing protein [Actinopolyspora mortivallis]|uniref:DUF742 domain-containing protein n=1 Tax=Actinopolyspora mortivallis TaxID=33906 RepID=UPI00037C0E3E|nr:DUF742 domain-containing protein [Actinopolyspora mortivallis]
MSRNSDYDGRREDEVGRRYGWDDDNEVDEATFADVYNGLNFGSRRGRRKQRKPAEHETDSARERSAREQSVTPPPVGRTGDDGFPAPAEGGGPEPAAEADAPAASIRSYAWTGGRTRTNVELELETLVSTGAGYRPDMPLRQEYQSVVQLCGQPRSVAEVGALLGVPFGVAKVLLADMAEQGLVEVHQTVTDSGSEPHMMLMERVLSGLRRL